MKEVEEDNKKDRGKRWYKHGLLIRFDSVPKNRIQGKDAAVVFI